MCVNQGRGRAVKILQHAANAKGAGLKVDGGAAGILFISQVEDTTLIPFRYISGYSKSGIPAIHRRKLLKQLKLPFTVVKPNIDESRKKNEPINQFVKRLSKEKAMKIALDHKDSIVIGSDEVAVCNNKVLGKPLTIKNAKKQLKLIDL